MRFHLDKHDEHDELIQGNSKDRPWIALNKNRLLLPYDIVLLGQNTDRLASLVQHPTASLVALAHLSCALYFVYFTNL